MDKQRKQFEEAFKSIFGFDAPEQPAMFSGGSFWMIWQAAIAAAEQAQQAEPVAEQPDDSQADVTEAKAFTRELSKVLAMQFNALADKVTAFGQDGFAAALRDDAAAFDTGMYDLNIISADWTTMADADKALALASHAGVALVYGDNAMGGSVLLQAAE